VSFDTITAEYQGKRILAERKGKVVPSAPAIGKGRRCICVGAAEREARIEKKKRSVTQIMGRKKKRVEVTGGDMPRVRAVAQST